MKTITGDIMGLGDLFKKNTSNESEKNNFTYLNNLIHNGQNEIVLDDNIIMETSFKHKEHQKFPIGILLDIDDLIIDGNGHTIDAKSKKPIFNCSGKNIILKNITFKNGFSLTQSGGALINELDASIKIINCNFVNNVAYDAGGAIYNLSNMSIENCKFSNNNVKNAGGAIATYNDSITHIEDTVFENNSANMGGGAIGNLGEITLVNCSISNNSSKKVGGALNNQKYGVFTAKNSKFINNHTDMDAGAIGNLGKCTLESCEFSKNSTKDYGDAIYNQPLAILNINNVDFIDHEVNYALLFNQGELNLNGGSFKDNHSKKADCLIFTDSQSNLTCSDYKFIKNHYKKGTCINNSSNDAKFSNCSFCNNKNNSVIFNRNKLDLIDCEFDNNESNFYIIDSFDRQSTLNIYGGVLSNNSAKTTLYNSGKSCKIINHTVFENNYSYIGSANDIINESYLNIQNINISGESGRKKIYNKGQLDVCTNDFDEELMKSFVNLNVENNGNVNYITNQNK